MARCVLQAFVCALVDAVMVLEERALTCLQIQLHEVPCTRFIGGYSTNYRTSKTVSPANSIVQAEFSCVLKQVTAMQVESTIEGENVMRMTNLNVDPPPAMAPSINITCYITTDSPLWGKTYADLSSDGAAIYVAVAATDNQHYQEVFARKFYRVPVRPFCSLFGVHAVCSCC